MEALANSITEITNPFAGFGRKVWRHIEIIGYARAASALANQGLHKEAQNCMNMIKKL